MSAAGATGATGATLSKGREVLLHFPTMSALADYAAEHNRAWEVPSTWAGGTFAECVRLTREGDLALARASEALLSKFESHVLPTKRREWVSDVAGVVPSVPAFIAGHPQAMRRRARREHEAAPVTVLVDVGVSAWFSTEQILARGAAILALVRVLARFRPVTLYVMDASRLPNGQRSCVSVSIATAPLDLAHAAWALCGTGFLRQIILPIQVRRCGTMYLPVYTGSLAEMMQGELAFGTYVVEVPGTSSAVTKDPQGWIEERIREAAPEVLGDNGEAL